MPTSQLPRWLMVQMQGRVSIPDKKVERPEQCHLGDTVRVQRLVGEARECVLIAPCPSLFSSALCHSVRYHPGYHWSTMIEAKSGLETSQHFKMHHVRELYSKYWVAELWLCPIRISNVTTDRDKPRIERTAYPLVMKKGGARRTRLKHRHQQFALSSLTGSGVEAEREIPILLESFATNDERKSPQMFESGAKMKQEP